MVNLLKGPFLLDLYCRYCFFAVEYFTLATYPGLGLTILQVYLLLGRKSKRWLFPQTSRKGYLSGIILILSLWMVTDPYIFQAHDSKLMRSCCECCNLSSGVGTNFLGVVGEVSRLWKGVKILRETVSMLRACCDNFLHYSFQVIKPLTF